VAYLKDMSASFRSRLRACTLLAIAGAVVFLGMQCIRPELTNPPVVADIQAPAPVKQILRNSCYNCHSNETRFVWFDKIAPAYWFVADDVKLAREHMNFSEFGQMPGPRQKAFLYEAVNQIQLGAMPLWSYKIAHPGSIVTAEELAVLKDYLHPREENEPATPEQIAAADSEYQKWISSNAAPAPAEAAPAPAPNGLAFFPDYKDWKPISSTDRFDNNTMRVVLGNDVAVRAIAENRIHPWPDGAAFAKVAWKQLPNDQGIVRTGEFLQVEFMTKDAHSYASTQGWGFGRWRGMSLTPYGRDSAFTVECTSCHAPMRDNDFVYTMPIKDSPAASDAINREAALPADLPDQPFQWRVVTSFIDKRHGAMSTLYGNDLAVSHARTSPQSPYPAGAALALVTWSQQEDRHWFGGRIPGMAQSLEFVTVNPAKAGKPSYSYQSYEGAPPSPIPSQDGPANQPRIDSILSQRASVMP
jgi:hypothetical protein